MAKMCLSLVFAILVAGASSEEELNTYSSDNIPEMPQSCQNMSYCFEKGEDYPEEKIEQLLADMREVKVKKTESRISIDSRIASTWQSECRSNSTNKPIYYIVDKNDKVRVVVQSPKKFQQIFTVKWCLDEGQITKNTYHFLKGSNILKKYEIECVTKKMDFLFFVLSDNVHSDSKKPMMEIASVKGRIPVCCRCRYNRKRNTY